MDPFQPVAEKLQELGIAYELVEHAPALTTEMADSFIEGIAGVRTKTMFLTNRKKSAYYLLIMDDGKRLDMDLFQDIAAEKRVKMASADSLREKMGLEPGIVSPFGLLNNAGRDIQVYMDNEIRGEERMSFHPNTNEKTIFLNTEDLLRFFDALGYTVHFVDL